MSVSYKLFENLLLRRLEPVFHLQLPDKQACFRHSQCTTDQVFKLAYDVEHRFEKNNKSGIVLTDSTGAHYSLLYGTKTKRPTTAFDFFFFIYHIYPPFTRKRCIAMFWAVSPHSLGSCHFRVTSLPHKGGASR